MFDVILKMISFVVVSAIFWVDVLMSIKCCEKKDWGVFCICAMNLIFLVCEVGERGI